ncbi:hypothetical protein EIN_397630 [Entamoeba invadens IP1]|uniref:UDENN domain-containing protein n=1 Tax=Entamoeba invadens IP1 TaxID=370355 RepID=A0A0A1U9X5_ENTIV|nr:hypothetical protein EIN_397630 [Entamoeba invadens IP1]ELP91863.1 hypothetical protein EIN_397630 [Entamoeba invadens IP1]|eukprot:XP_004258634.1 hypothetical protein EIN_397630 [Entamoeba invadens IP1]
MKPTPVMDGVVVFSSCTVDVVRNVFPPDFVYPKHFGEYCNEEKVLEFQVAIFTDDKNNRQYGHLIGIDNQLSLIVFTTKLWVSFFRYFMAKLAETYKQDQKQFERTVDYFLHYKVSPSTTYISHPASNVLFGPIPPRSGIYTDAFGYLASIDKNTLRCLLVSILNERRIVVVGNTNTEISVAVLLLLEVIEPFEWVHLLITHLPSSMKSITQSPMPYIIGMCRADFFEINNDVIVFDVNSKTIKSTDVTTTQKDIDLFPKKLFDQLTDAIEEIDKMPKTQKEKRELYKIKFTQFIWAIIEQVNKEVELSYENDKVVGKFNEDSFIKNSDSDVQEFLKIFKRTSLLRNFVDRIVNDFAAHPLQSHFK